MVLPSVSTRINKHPLNCRPSKKVWQPEMHSGCHCLFSFSCFFCSRAVPPRHWFPVPRVRPMMTSCLFRGAVRQPKSRLCNLQDRILRVCGRGVFHAMAMDQAGFCSFAVCDPGLRHTNNSVVHPKYKLRVRTTPAHSRKTPPETAIY